MNRQKSSGVKTLIKWTLLLSTLALIIIAGWATTDYALHKTSDAAFCGSCHSMKPMQASFLQDKHGGHSTTGIQALCTDCHLPQDNYISYLYMKGKNGAWDVWKEFVLGAGDVDWHAKRAEANRYTYDSGCLKCHNTLISASELNNKQFVAHKPYFQKRTEKTCVDCHKVGHKNLSLYLPQVANAPTLPN
nr:NapC/NirT family cytochrome c [Oceanospirillum beijerinckii]